MDNMNEFNKSKSKILRETAIFSNNYKKFDAD